MADSTADGRIKIYAVVTIANIAAPTTSELNAGIDLTPYITPGGFQGFEADTATVDSSKINSTFNTGQPGRISFGNQMIEFIKQTGTDSTYNTLIYGYVTNIVIRQDVAYATAWASSQAVRVYPVTCGEVKEVTTAPNEMHKYQVPMISSSQPNQRAAVA